MVKMKRSKSESDLINFTETGNRIIRGDYDENSNEVILLYRGIKPHSGPYQEQTAQHAIIGPKKPLDTTQSILDHIDGQTNSAYTSWTPNYDIAKEFAGERGIVMKGVFRKKDLVHPVESFGEIEYSIIGSISGAKPCNEDPLKKLSEKEKREKIHEQYKTWANSKGRQAAESEEQKDNNPKNKDPLVRGNQRIRTEFTPTGEKVREWLIKNNRKTQLVSGPNAPTPHKQLLRTKSEPNVKYRSNPLKNQEEAFKKPLENSAMPEIKNEKINVDPGRDRSMAMGNKILPRVKAVSSFTSMWKKPFQKINKKIKQLKNKKMQYK